MCIYESDTPGTFLMLCLGVFMIAISSTPLLMRHLAGSIWTCEMCTWSYSTALSLVIVLKNTSCLRTCDEMSVLRHFSPNLKMYFVSKNIRTEFHRQMKFSRFNVNISKQNGPRLPMPANASVDRSTQKYINRYVRPITVNCLWSKLIQSVFLSNVQAMTIITLLNEVTNKKNHQPY